MIKPPIFIVGAPRSGTTLLSAFLSSHSKISCGPETHFFNKLELKDVISAVNDKDWPNQGTELVISLKLSDQNIYQLFGLSVSEIRNYLSQKNPSHQALLESLTYQFSIRQDKYRWAEKTPNHLLHLPLIRKLYPHSPIIRIVRDPRDSATSMRKLPWASRSILANGYLLNEWFTASQVFCGQDNNTLTIRYEDLVLNPQKILKIVCDHIHEDFEKNMLDTSKSGLSVSSPNEVWKEQVRHTLDSSRLYAWKKDLPENLFIATTYACQDIINMFQYENVRSPKEIHPVYFMNRQFIEQNNDLFIKFAKQRQRIVNIHQSLQNLPSDMNNSSSVSKTIFFFQIPEIGGGAIQKFCLSHKFIVKLIIYRLKGYSLVFDQNLFRFQDSKSFGIRFQTLALSVLGTAQDSQKNGLSKQI